MNEDLLGYDEWKLRSDRDESEVYGQIFAPDEFEWQCPRCGDSEREGG